MTIRTSKEEIFLGTDSSFLWDRNKNTGGTQWMIYVNMDIYRYSGCKFCRGRQQASPWLSGNGRGQAGIVQRLRVSGLAAHRGHSASGRVSSRSCKMGQHHLSLRSVRCKYNVPDQQVGTQEMTDAEL